MVELFFRLPIPIQVIVMFLGWFIFLFVSFTTDRVIGIRIWGSKKQYFKYSNNHITYKQIWSSSAIFSLIITLFSLAFIFTNRH